VFAEILTILHKAYESKTRKEHFSFEITKVGNRIRFFLICSPKHTEFLKNQIYAHFSNVEIIPSTDILAKVPTEKMFVGKVKLKKHYLYSLKTFLEPSSGKGKGEIDPFSSITSALSKTGKYTLNTLQVNFSPIPAKLWKKDAKKIIPILNSSSPQFLKDIMLSPAYAYGKIAFSPIILLGKFIQILIPGGEEKLIRRPEEE